MRHFKHLALISMILPFGQLQASGFALIEQSASGQGLSYAGAAANPEDASVMWFNPAGLTQIKGDQIVGALHVISPKLAFSNEGSFQSQEIPIIGAGGPIDGADDDGAQLGLVPNFFWKTSYGEIDFGFGLNVPYGSHLLYDESWVGRYHAVETDLKTVNLNPVMATKITSWLAFGAGLNVQYVDLILTQAMNNNLSLETDSADGEALAQADSIGFGYNLGLLFTPTDSTTIGLAYRSKVNHSAEGEITYSNITDTLAYNTVNVENGTFGVSSDVSLPATTMLSVKQEIGDKFALLADATLTEWSQFKELVIEFDSEQDDLNSRQGFEDAWRYSIGALYHSSPSLTWRTGFAIDHTPVPNADSRSPRTPDSKRTWYSVGVGYQMTKSLKMDLAYSYLKGEKAPVNYTTDDVHFLIGDYEAEVDIFSGQLVWSY
ncbi:outer membrane protein transport protein [Thiomicrorhabdus sp. 6S2-11]|uniref:Outer membrane protein transport protein n=1 Tax=Thiomicrorhabdus marina TaxID=2818442 RepID=A0ABS3Q1S8_9GAMM|nr:outer membrane protein transport protein [Thiomicrorhabdus marina]MBO1926272.1 outer membrane protein transport protein [Thiomicrorhabdus marina]